MTIRRFAVWTAAGTLVAETVTERDARAIAARRFARTGEACRVLPLSGEAFPGERIVRFPRRFSR